MLVARMEVYELGKVVQRAWCLLLGWAPRFLLSWVALLQSSVGVVWLVTCTGTPLKRDGAEGGLFSFGQGLVY